MNTQTLTYLLEHPENITNFQSTQLEAVLNQYPFFQAARALRLKSLKNQDSTLYNNELKRTAAHTQDRTVLFEFITSKSFTEHDDVSSEIKLQEERLRNMAVVEASDVSIQLEQEELQKANDILDPEIFIPKKSLPETTLTPSKESTSLNIGKPLDFDAKETHSFNEWLQLTALKPIDRNPIATATLSDKKDPQKQKKINLIDRFLKTNPKMSINSDEVPPRKNVAEENLISSETLMTETLARVYLEQKNYKKACQAYKILCLKYPEKSGFFADQIRAIEKLQ